MLLIVQVTPTWNREAPELSGEQLLRGMRKDFQILSESFFGGQPCGNRYGILTMVCIKLHDPQGAFFILTYYEHPTRRPCR